MPFFPLSQRAFGVLYPFTWLDRGAAEAVSNRFFFCEFKGMKAYTAL